MEFVMVLAIIIFIGFFLAFRPKHTYNQVPRIIWTYWEEPDHLDPYKRMTKEARDNIATWRTLNPEYKIVILTKKTYQGYVTIPEDLRENPTFVPDHFPSLLKLWTLAEHGGVWLDPTYPLDKPLDDWLFPKYAEFAGISHNREISSRFFAANKGSKFMEAWKREFSEAVRFPNMEKYMADRAKVLSSTQEPIQVAVQTVLQYERFPTDSMILHAPIL
jgi:mannosyltransferase OCH1-like enzyme